MLAALLQQPSDPDCSQPLGLAKVLGWTAALDRVDPAASFSQVNEGEPAPCFCEPFLEAFDSEPCKRLGALYALRYHLFLAERMMAGERVALIGVAP